MQKKLKLAVLALCSSSMMVAQNTDTKTNQQAQTANAMDESAFTFTEAQLGENNDMNENVTILNSNSNVYASQVGFLYSPMRFRYRALNQKYNDVYINGAPMNDMESGQFRYSMVGGINQQTRNVDYALPFENNNFSMTALAGSNNYDFRAGSMAGGHRLTLSAANRNYTLRGMYTTMRVDSTLRAGLLLPALLIVGLTVVTLRVLSITHCLTTSVFRRSGTMVIL